MIAKDASGVGAADRPASHSKKFIVNVVRTFGAVVARRLLFELGKRSVEFTWQTIKDLGPTIHLF